MFAPVDLVAAHPWRKAVFTTYALSLSFFEAVVLDALVRGGARGALILADVEGVRVALSEHGARRVGREYEVEPLVVRSGVFHPKISVLIGQSDCHLLVGSGNLTFGGWGGNLENIEHLHPGFAADAIEDAAEFFDYLALADHVRHGVSTRCTEVANDLRASARGRTRTGNFRLLHNLDGSISQKLAAVAEDLGGAVRLAVAAPFWDGGTAIDGLCTALGVAEVSIHAHSSGTVEGTAGSNWPANTVAAVQPMRLEIMGEDESRKLHAKLFEVICRRGRLVLSGSANATTAALGSKHNVEACILRIQRESVVGWRFSPAEPLELRVGPDEAEEDDLEKCGVLRATLESDDIVGQVLTPVIRGEVQVYQTTAEGLKKLGQSSVGPDARFSVAAPGLEIESWKGLRLVLQIQGADGRRAEGFVSVSAFAEITRRAGSLAPRLFAILSGTETPADVAAIMSWFYDDPRRLADAMPATISGGADEQKKDDDSARRIAVNELNSSHAVSLARTAESHAPGAVTWRRFIDHILAAFRQRRGPFGGSQMGRPGDDEDDDASGSSDQAKKADPAVARSLEVFNKLFELMLSPANASRHGMIAFDLAQYVCERLQPDHDVARAWLEKLVETLSHTKIPAERSQDIAAAVLLLLTCDGKPNQMRAARARLSRIGVSLIGPFPSMEAVRGFQSALLPTIEVAAAWNELGSARTFAEQIHAYLIALKAGKASTGYGDLPEAASEEWSILRDAIGSPEGAESILLLDAWSDACPLHNRTLPFAEIHKLRSVGIATARNCCQRVLICTEI